MSGDQQIRSHASFIWSVADKLRGVYKQSEYGRVILPLVVLRRLDCVLEPTKAAVLQRAAGLKGRVENVEPVLCAVSGEQFYNTSPLDFRRLLDDPSNVAGNLRSYIAGFSPAARDIVDKFGFDAQISRLTEKNLLYLVISQFAEIDLHPDAVSNLEMGYLYEELIRRFSELSNETAGEHFTPREVIRLMVNLLFIEDDDLLSKPGVVKTLYDPACGTGGMLSIAEEHLRALNPVARLEVFGQELNAETYAVARSDMMLKGQDSSHIHFGNSFTEDGETIRKFDYMLANPPFGVDWKKVSSEIKREHEVLAFQGRFGAGLPSISDGSLLFLQHMLSKMRPPDEGGSRVAIVFSASPLFTGVAGSGPSEIRRWIIESDLLEAVVALPDQLFYNTPIGTFVWILSNRKRLERRGLVQLLDARDLWVKAPRKLGDKKKQIDSAQVEEITRVYGAFEESERVRIKANETFGFLRVTVDRSLRVRWVVNEDTLEVIAVTKKLVLNSSPDVATVLARLRRLAGAAWGDRAEAMDAVSQAFDGAAERRIISIIVDALAQRDPAAVALVKSSGARSHDPELRDYEEAPMPLQKVERFEADPSSRIASPSYRAAVSSYIAENVTPFEADCWYDEESVRLGYTISFETEFFRPTKPPDLENARHEVAELLEALREIGSS